MGSQPLGTPAHLLLLLPLQLQLPEGSEVVPLELWPQARVTFPSAVVHGLCGFKSWLRGTLGKGLGLSGPGFPTLARGEQQAEVWICPLHSYTGTRWALTLQKGPEAGSGEPQFQQLLCDLVLVAVSLWASHRACPEPHSSAWARVGPFVGRLTQGFGSEGL